MADASRLLPVDGGTLGLVIDEPDREPVGTVAVFPPFGMSGTDMISLGLLLSRNGLRVVRVDGRDNLGSGSGGLFDYRLSTVRADVDAVLDEFPDAMVLGISLACRPILAALAARPAPPPAVLVTPVVNVRSTLEAVLSFDAFAFGDAELADWSLRVFGHDVSGQFVVDARRKEWVDASDAERDLARVRSDIVVLAGASDAWVDVDDVRRVTSVSAPAARVLRTIPAASHELTRNPVVAMRYLRAAAEACTELCDGTDVFSDLLFSEIVEASSARRRGAHAAARPAYPGGNEACPDGGAVVTPRSVGTAM